MTDLTPTSVTTRRLTFDPTRDESLDPSLEWLVTNGLGGYASGPVPGSVTRRYHGVLIGACPPPLGRMVFVSHLQTTLLFAQRHVLLDHQRLEVLDDAPTAALLEFRLENGLPIWRYRVDHTVIERRVLMPFHQNTTLVCFRILETASPVRLRIQPLSHLRQLEAPVSTAPIEPTSISVDRNTAELTFAEDWAWPIRYVAFGGDVQIDFNRPHRRRIRYIEEHSRGYDDTGTLWTPGCIDLEFDADGAAAVAVSIEPWDRLRPMTPTAVLEEEERRRLKLIDQAKAASGSMPAELALAADQFIIAPIGHAADRRQDAPASERERSVIAGYHWFTDWGRDTMISLEGLTLATGRASEAARILRMFGHHVHHGLIPNLFPEAERTGLYHTADATLWFFHAIDRYTRATGDRGVLTDLLPGLRDIVDRHRQGTDFGIGVDDRDGLLRQGAPGYALTWMDAKFEGWVVTPRRGKAVEINGLWYNALRLLEGWLRESGDDAGAARCHDDAERAKRAFNARFWNPATNALFDIVDGEQGDDPSIRPNQLFAISLPNPVLDEDRWPAVLDTVRGRLLTPLGLRTLAPDDPAFQSQYHGNLRTRDSAYHQGTVWAWLIGAFVDAWLKVHPDDTGMVRDCLQAFDGHLSRAGIGTISEIFDAETPHTPRGCIAQAWSVAEVLRSWLRLAQ